MFNFFFSFLTAINANDSKHQMAFGFAFGAILGLTPAASLHNIVILLLIYFLNVNLSVVMVSAMLYKIIGVVISQYSHMLGYYLLVDQTQLFNFWTRLYNMPIIPWTRFYNTVVMGSFVIAILMFIPNYFLFRLFLDVYRRFIRDNLKKLAIFKLIGSSSLYQMYLKFRKVKEGL